MSNDITLHVGQSLAWQSKAKVVAMIAGTGGGKTYMGARWIYKKHSEAQTLHTPKIVISASYPMMGRVTLPTFLDFWRPLDVGEYRTFDRTFLSKVGGPVYFGSAEKPYGMEGIHAGAAWLDEAGMMDRLVFDVVRRRTAFRNGQILITTTPYTANWLKTEIFDNATVDRVIAKDPTNPKDYEVKRIQTGDRDYYVVQFSSLINPEYPVEEYLEAKASWPEWKFKMFFEGEFERPMGLIFNDFIPTLAPEGNIVKSFDVPTHWERRVGVDIGFNHPTGILWIATDPNTDSDFVYREFKDVRLDGPDIGKTIVRMSVDHDRKRERLGTIWVDPSRPDVIRQINREVSENMPAGARARPANNSVEAGLLEVIERLRSRELLFFEGLEKTFDELGEYHWEMSKADDGELTDKPVKFKDDLMDALRYMTIMSGAGKRGSMGMFVI